MKDIKNCIVGVYVNSKLQGTGYVVTPQLIITCAHVLTDKSKPTKDKVTVKFHCREAKPRAVAVEVLTEFWSPAANDDVAVLKFKALKKLPDCVQIASLARSEGRKNRECEVFGYPDLAEMNGLGGRAKVIEEVRQFDNRELIQLESTQATCGYSGSPLFDSETGEVIGTIVEIAKAAKARYSEFLHSRLDNLAFATPMSVIIGIVPSLSIDTKEDAESREKTHFRVCQGILKILSDHPEAITFLEGFVKGIDKLSMDAKKEKLVDYLLDLSLADFVPCVLKGYADNAKVNVSVAAAFRELALYTLPQIYKPEFLSEVHRTLNKGENFLAIVTSHKSIIELVIAGVLGQKLAFNDEWKFAGGIPTGKRELPFIAELGILDGEVRQKAMKSFERGIIDKIGGLSAEMPDPTKAINRKLAKLKIAEPPIRYYYVFDQKQSRIEELESKYPDVVFFWHEKTGHDDTEFDILDGLKGMFCPESER